MKQNFTVIALVLLLVTVQCQFDFASPIVNKFLNSFEQNRVQEKAQSSPFTYILKIHYPTEESIEASIQELNKYRDQIQNLEIQMVNCNQEVDLSTVKSMVNLQTINFIYLYGRCNLQGLEILEKSRQLTRLSASVLGTSDQNLQGLEVIQNLSSLQYINLDIRLSTFQVETIDLSQLSALEEMHISHEQTQQYNFSGLQNLRVLDLQYSGCQFTSLDFLRTLETSSNLKELTLNYSYNKGRSLNNVDIISHIAQITSLESLYLGFSSYSYSYYSGGMRMTGKVIRDITPMSDLNQLENLKSLKINISSNIISDFEALVQGIFPLENLTTLDINCKSNQKTDNKFGYPNIKNVFDRQFSGKIENYKFQ